VIITATAKLAEYYRVGYVLFSAHQMAQKLEPNLSVNTVVLVNTSFYNDQNKGPSSSVLRRC
jgi:hypothetical protein